MEIPQVSTHRKDDGLFALLCGVLIFCALYFGAVLGAHGSTTTRGEYSHSLKSGTTAFHIRVDSPHKIILYPEASPVKTSYSIVCTKSGKFSYNARTFTQGYTRNLLYGIPSRQDRCDLAIAAVTPSHKGQIVIDVMDH
jgi:hypothetical protein